MSRRLNNVSYLANGHNSVYIGLVYYLETGIMPSWEAPYQLGLEAVHTVHLRTGKLLIYSNNQRCVVWNGSSSLSGQLSPPNPPRDSNDGEDSIFCAGHAVLPDGRVIVAGGQKDGTNELGPRSVDIFDPSSGTNGAWATGGGRPDDLSIGRWYPSCTILHDGKCLVSCGLDENGDPATSFDLYSGADLVDTFDVSDAPPFANYPWMFMLPEQIDVGADTFPAGSVFFAGPYGARVYDITQDPVVISDDIVADPDVGLAAGSAVMYRPGHVMKCGGEADDHMAIDGAAFIDMTEDDPSWQEFPPLNHARVNHNLVLLPTGEVLCVGGNLHGAHSASVGPTHPHPVLAAEIIDPVAAAAGTVTEWSELPAMADPRWYHSSAVLLRDARVLIAGGAFYRTGQIFRPPYLDGNPQRISFSAPSNIYYGINFQVTQAIPDEGPAPTIARAMLTRPGSCTHSFDQEQRFIELSRSGSTITPPANSKIAPPGYYLLWLVDTTGVPCSLAAYVKLQ